MHVSHPECDVRPWLAAHGEAIAPYTAGRIRASYAALPSVLSACPDIRGGVACDTGCGAGFDTFALGMYFDRVVGIDRNRAAIREARRLANRTGVSHLAFKCRPVERFRPPEPFDFMYCNLMSHQAVSRSLLLRILGTALRPGGYLFYSEETEGYGPMEGHGAILQRNRGELEQRCHQVLNGFSGACGFRFFLAGTAASLGARCGLEVVWQERLEWNGLPYVEKLLLRRREAMPVLTGAEGDYLDPEADFVAVGQRFSEGIKDLRRGRLPPEGAARIRGLAHRRENRYFPYLYYLLIVDALSPTPEFWPGGPWDRVRHRLLRRFQPPPPQPDWTALESLDREFLEHIRMSAGRISGLAD